MFTTSPNAALDFKSQWNVLFYTRKQLCVHNEGGELVRLWRSHDVVVFLVGGSGVEEFVEQTTTTTLEGLQWD